MKQQKKSVLKRSHLVISSALLVFCCAVYMILELQSVSPLSRKLSLKIQEVEAEADASPAQTPALMGGEQEFDNGDSSIGKQGDGDRHSHDTRVNFSLRHVESFLDADSRTKTVHEIFEAIDSAYGLRDYKIHKDGIDGNEIKRRAEKLEQSFLFEKPSEQIDREKLMTKKVVFFSKWLDRLRSYLAYFEDSQLSLIMQTQLPIAYLGFQSHLIDDAVVVSMVSQHAVEHNPGINVGDEILSIDGKSIKDGIRELSSMISQSSDRQRKFLAAKAVSQRSFYYPETAYANIEIKSRLDRKVRSYNLPWFVDGARDNLFTQMLLNQGLAYKPFSETFAADNLGQSQDLPSIVREKVSWYEASSNMTQGSLRFQTGFLKRSGKSIGVIKIHSFASNELISSDGQKSQSWQKPISAFVRNLRQKELPLILDLRDAKTGPLSRADSLVRALTATDESYSSYTQVFRLSPKVSADQSDDFFTQKGSFPQRLIAKYMSQALLNRNPMSLAWTNSDGLGNDPEVGGYNQKIAVLISSACMQVCELAASLLGEASRVIFVGEETNGSASSFFSVNSPLRYDWSSRDQAIRINIPTRILGRPGSVGRKVFLTEEFMGNLCFEKKPILPDFPVYDGIIDFLRPHQAIYQAAINAMHE